MIARQFRNIVRAVTPARFAQRYPSTDLRGISATPLEAYYDGGGGPCIVTMSLGHCRWMGPSGFAYSADSGHPYVRTLVEYGRGDVTDYTGSYLERYWDSWQPKTLVEAFGLDPAGSNPLLLDTPPMHGIEPWSREARIAYLKKRGWERRKSHQSLVDDGAPTARSSGPKPEWYGRERFAHLRKIYEMIKREGYRQHAPDTLPYKEQHIVGACLVRGSESRLIVLNGQHRAAAMAALGQDEAPVILYAGMNRGNGFVRREDAEHWPLVRAGIFSLDQALEVFDRIFDGRQPEGLTVSTPESARGSGVEVAAAG